MQTTAPAVSQETPADQLDPNWSQPTPSTDRMYLHRTDDDGADLILSVYPTWPGTASTGAWTWEWSRCHAYGSAYARAYGQAETAPAAQLAVQAFRPAAVVLEYAGKAIQWSALPQLAEETRWSAWIDGTLAEVREIHHPMNPGEPWLWSRETADVQVQAVLALCGRYMMQIEGYAPTRRDAMIAAVGAPERFRLACAAVGSELREVAA